MQAELAAFNRCVAPAGEVHTWWVLGALGALAVLTLGTFWLMPWWKIRRGRLVPLGSASSRRAGLDAELGELVREAGLARAPVFLLDPAGTAFNGLAFGAFGRYYVRLDAGLIVLRARDRAGFRAVIRHELAHLRNRDVDQTYLTVALWRAFLLMFLVPLAAISVAPRLVSDPLGIKTPSATPSTLASVTEFWLPMACLVAMVYLIRNAVLRARELRADARAAAAGSGEDLARMLGPADPAGRHPPGGGHGGPDHAQALRRRLRGLLGTHPAAQARSEAVSDPGMLFRFGFWEAAAAGVSVSVTYLLLSLSLSLSVFTLPGNAAAEPTALILAVITGGLITLGIWRGSWYALASSHPLPSVIRPGLGLAAGLAAGAVLTRPAVRLLPPQSAVVIGVTLAVVVGWVAGLAAAWLPTLRGRSPRWPLLAATAAAVVVIAALFQLWLAPDGLPAIFSVIERQLAPVYERAAALSWAGPRWLWEAAWTPLLLSTTAMRLTFVAFLLLWAAPLLGWLRAPRAGAAGVLPPRAAPPPLPRDPPRLRPVLAVGAVAGGFAFAAPFALRAALHVSLPAGVRNAAAFALPLTFWEVGLAVVAQVLAAGLIAATARRRGVVLAMLAAFITALLAVLGMVASARVGSCVPALTIRPEPCQLVPYPPFIGLTLQLTVLDGGAAALMVALAVAGVRAVLGLRRGAAAHAARAGELGAGGAPPAGAARAGRAPRRQLAVMAGVVAVLAAATMLAWPSGGSAPGSPAAAALTLPLTPRQAVTAWWQLGGEVMARALDGDLLTTSKATSRAALSAACSATRTDAGQAIGFAPVPDAATQHTWSHAVAELRRGASDCLRALGGAGRQAAVRSGGELADGARELSQAINHIEALIDGH